MTDCVDEPLGELVALPQRVPVRLPETVVLRVRVTVAELERERVPVTEAERHSVALLVMVALEVVLGHPVMLPVTLLLDEALTEKVTDELPQLEAADEGDTMAAEDAPPEGLTL